MLTVLLCGGRGERLRPLTDNYPKPSLIIGGKPWLDRVIEEYAIQGLRTFLLVAGYKGEQIVQMYAEWGQWRGLDVHTIVLEPQGTLNALGFAWKDTFTKIAWGNRFLLANGDTLVQTSSNFRNFSGKMMGFKIRQIDCGVRLLWTEEIVKFFTELPGTTRLKSLPNQTIEEGLLPKLEKFKWQSLNYEESRFIDMGTPEDYERAKVIFR